MKTYILILSIAFAGCGQKPGLPSGGQDIDTSSPEYRFARDRAQEESIEQTGSALSSSFALLSEQFSHFRRSFADGSAGRIRSNCEDATAARRGTGSYPERLRRSTRWATCFFTRLSLHGTRENHPMKLSRRSVHRMSAKDGVVFCLYHGRSGYFTFLCPS